MVLFKLSHSFVIPQEQSSVVFLAKLFQEIKTTSLHHMLSSPHLVVYKSEEKTEYHHKHNKRDLTTN